MELKNCSTESEYYQESLRILKDIDSLNSESKEYIYFNHSSILNDLKDYLTTNLALDFPKKLKAPLTKKLESTIKEWSKPLFKYKHRPSFTNSDFIKYQEFSHYLTWFLSFNYEKARYPFSGNLETESQTIIDMTKELLRFVNFFKDINYSSCNLIFPEFSHMGFNPKKLTHTKFLQLLNVLEDNCNKILETKYVQVMMPEIHSVILRLELPCNGNELNIFQDFFNVLYSLKNLVSQHPSLCLELKDFFKGYQISIYEETYIDLALYTGCYLENNLISQPDYYQIIKDEDKLALKFSYSKWVEMSRMMMNKDKYSSNLHSDFNPLDFNHTEPVDKKSIPLFYSGTPEYTLF